MSNAATLIAERIPHGLPHPGNPAVGQKPFTIPLPGLRSTGIPPEMARQFTQEAGLPSADVPRLIGEAIVNLIETDGNTIMPNAELAQLRQAAADAPDGTRVVVLRCRCHNREVMRLTIGKGSEIVVDPTHLTQAAANHEAA